MTQGDDGTVIIHATLVSVHNVGVLLTGAAGTGKSSCALGLVERGHKLVADDVVGLEWSGGVLIGGCPAGLEGILSLRPIGLIDVRKVFDHGAAIGSAIIRLTVNLYRPGSEEAEGGEPVIPGVRDPAGVRSIGVETDQVQIPLLIETAVKALFISDGLVDPTIITRSVRASEEK